MIKTPLSTVIGGAFWTPGATILGSSPKNLTQLIKSLFANNEQGFFYDPFDMSTMYQDAAGITPVSVPAQPVGLMLDKSKGLVLGSEIILNGQFTAGFTNWLNSNNHWSVVNGRAYHPASANLNALEQIFSSKPSRLKVVFDVEVIQGTAQVLFVPSNTLLNIGVTPAKQVTLIAPAGTTNIQFKRLQTGAAAEFYIDNISIKEITGNHAYQTTSAARPLLRQVPILGNELVVNGDFSNGITGFSPKNNVTLGIVDGALKVTNSDVYFGFAEMSFPTTIGKQYLLRADTIASSGAGAAFHIASVTSSNDIASNVDSISMAKGVIITAKSTTTYISLKVPTNVVGSWRTFDNVSAKEITSYRTDQNSIEYDGVDDKLLTTFAAPLTNCTVVRAVPNEGTKILYNQTLPASYEDTLNHAGFFAINRALSNSEKVLLLNEMDKRTGVTSLDSQVARSFANNEVGVAFNDFNDMSLLSQDAAGTVPVTAVGQPVGLVLDKSKGLALGPELFNDATVTFNGAGGDTVTRLSPGLYRFVSSTNLIYLGAVLPIQGKAGYFLVDYEIVRLGSGSLRFDINNGVNVEIPATVGRRTIGVFTDRLTIARRTTPLDCDIRIHSIREIYGNHAYQTVSASRPILQRNATTGAYYLAFDGVDDFLQTNNIDFTSTDKVSVFAGVKRNDTSSGVIAELGNDTTNNKFFLVNEYRFLSRGAANYSSLQRAESLVSTPFDYAVITARGDVSANLNTIRYNGVKGKDSTASLGAGKFINSQVYIGRRGGTSLPFNGHLYSLVIIGRLASDTETTVLENAIAKQVGVTL